MTGVHIDDGVVCVTSRDGLRAGCDRVAAGASHMLPLSQAAARGDLALIFIEGHEAAFPAKRIEKAGRPVVVVVGDDPWPAREATGPTGWRCAQRLRYWRPQAVVVHGTGPHPDHYRAVVAAARLVRRVALVETASAFIEEWAAFLGCASTLRIRPPAGHVHPDRSAPAVLQ